MEALQNASADDMAAIDGFGSVMAVAVSEFFSLPGTAHLIGALRELGLNMEEPLEEKPAGGADLSGKTFVLTGTLPTLKRQEAAALIEKAGAKSAVPFRKKRPYVVAGEEAAANSPKPKPWVSRSWMKRPCLPCWPPKEGIPP